MTGGLGGGSRRCPGPLPNPQPPPTADPLTVDGGCPGAVPRPKRCSADARCGAPSGHRGPLQRQWPPKRWGGLGGGTASRAHPHWSTVSSAVQATSAPSRRCTGAGPGGAAAARWPEHKVSGVWPAPTELRGQPVPPDSPAPPPPPLGRQGVGFCLDAPPPLACGGLPKHLRRWTMGQCGTQMGSRKGSTIAFLQS